MHEYDTALKEVLSFLARLALRESTASMFPSGAFAWPITLCAFTGRSRFSAPVRALRVRDRHEAIRRVLEKIVRLDPARRGRMFRLLDACFVS